jgi:Tol biopolymer transport system component
VPSGEVYDISVTAYGSKVAVIGVNAGLNGLTVMVAVGGSIGGGYSWQTSDLPGGGGMHTPQGGTVRWSADGRLLVACATAGERGYVYTSTDNGATWTEQTDAGSKYWTSLVVSADGTKIVAGEKEGIARATMSSGSNAISEVTPDNAQVTGITTWGTGSALTLSTDGYVMATGELTLDVEEIGQIVASGAARVITVEAGGSIQFKNQTKILVRPETCYRLRVKV